MLVILMFVVLVGNCFVRVFVRFWLESMFFCISLMVLFFSCVEVRVSVDWVVVVLGVMIVVVLDEGMGMMFGMGLVVMIGLEVLLGSRLFFFSWDLYEVMDVCLVCVFGNLVRMVFRIWLFGMFCCSSVLVSDLIEVCLFVILYGRVGLFGSGILVLVGGMGNFFVIVFFVVWIVGLKVLLNLMVERFWDVMVFGFRVWL